jgi:hypothetical protein
VRAARTLTSAAAAALALLLDGVAAWLVTVGITESTKMWLGVYRPNWLAHCKPSMPDSIQVSLLVAAEVAGLVNWHVC